jgi:hypothetical protein
MNKSDVEDITSLIRRRAGLPKLDPAKERQPIAGKSSVSTKKEISATSTGGYVSPWTESLPDRELHVTEHTLTSSDGFFVIVYQNVSKRVFDGPASEEEIRNYADE